MAETILTNVWGKQPLNKAFATAELKENTPSPKIREVKIPEVDQKRYLEGLIRPEKIASVATPLGKPRDKGTILPDEMQASITCPRCGMTSYNPGDIEEKYCGKCNRYHADMKKIDGATPSDFGVVDVKQVEDLTPVDLEFACCKSKKNRCKHWVWDAENGEGYVNTLSGRVQEAA